MMRRQWSQKGRRRNFPTISFCGARHYRVLKESGSVYFGRSELWVLVFFLIFLTSEEREREREAASVWPCYTEFLAGRVQGGYSDVSLFGCVVWYVEGSTYSTQHNINRLDFKQQSEVYYTGRLYFYILFPNMVFIQESSWIVLFQWLPLRQTSLLVPHLCLTAMKKSHPFRRWQDRWMGSSHFLVFFPQKGKASWGIRHFLEGSTSGWWYSYIIHPGILHERLIRDC